MTASSEPALADRYQLGELIGAGGMADVHRATDLLLGREVAVKLLRPRPDGNGAAERFRSEARTLAAVSDPQVITILDVSPPDAPRPFLVMELIDGPTLSQRLHTGGPMDEETVRALGAQLARGLAAAHRRGIIHRDVKPGNILLKPDDTAVLTDFGIARLEDEDSALTATGHVIGSPAYLAPEQVSGGPATAAVDIYALGLVLLEVYTGTRAYPGPPVEAALARLTVAPAIPVSLPSDVRALLVAMTALEPADRPSAEGVAAVLDPLGSAPVAAAPIPIDVHTEEYRLPPAQIGPQTSAIAATPARTPVRAGRRRTVLTVVAAGTAALAFWFAGPLGLAADTDPTEVQDQPTSPATPVADPPSSPATQEVAPTPAAESPAGHASGGSGGGTQSGPAEKPAGAPEKAKEPAQQGKGNNQGSDKGSENGNGSGKGRP